MPERNDESRSAGQRGGPHSAESVKATIKEAAKEVGERLKRDAADAAENVQAKAAEAVQTQRAMAAERIDRVADAIRHTAEGMDEDDEFIGHVAEQAADRVHDVSEYVRGHELRDIVDDIEGLARDHPVLYCAGAFLAGALVARFLKSSADRRAEDRAEGRGGESEESTGSARSQTGGSSRRAATASSRRASPKPRSPRRPSTGRSS